jgi:hypothetical protein
MTRWESLPWLLPPWKSDRKDYTKPAPEKSSKKWEKCPNGEHEAQAKQGIEGSTKVRFLVATPAGYVTMQREVSVQMWKAKA